MRPILMIEGLKNLHDARYCAAVGISIVTFDMDAANDGALSPAVVKEIVEWLSGLECIGQFGQEEVNSITEKATLALIDRVMLPIGYTLEAASKLAMPLLFDASEEVLSAQLSQRLQAIHSELPEALFLIRIQPSALASTDWIQLLQLVLGNTILRYDDPQEIYLQLNAQSTMPFGFCLGSFATDQSGYLDYDSCDSFLETFQSMVPA